MSFSLIADIRAAARGAASDTDRLPPLAERAIEAIMSAISFASGRPDDTAWADAYGRLEEFVAAIRDVRLTTDAAHAFRACRSFLAENADLVRS